MARLLISAAHKSSGKTTVSLGLAAAMADAGTRVQPFKKGPDYIDPMWLQRAAGQPCYNLDFNTMGGDEIASLFHKRAAGSDIALVEANKGLYDGVDPEGADSNAALAKLLKLPVVLVIDTVGMTRGIAPLLVGYQQFDWEVAIKGVILNRCGGARHEGKLRAAVEQYTDLPVLGAIGRDPSLSITERHLGLTTPGEIGAVDTKIRAITAIVRDSVDIERVKEIARSAPTLVAPCSGRPAPAVCQWPLRIAIASDAAFGFYYPDDLEMMQAAGAELRPFDTLRDQALPEADGLLIGGGFPEMHGPALAANAALRGAIRRAIEAGMPAYAECGGLMYLSRSLSWQGKTHEMVGVVPGDVVMHERPQGRGHVRLGERDSMPWPTVGSAGGPHSITTAHEFHYASLENVGEGLSYAYDVRRGHGIDGRRDGLIVHNLLAGFTHLRHTTAMPWISRFLAFVAAKARN